MTKFKEIASRFYLLWLMLVFIVLGIFLGHDKEGLDFSRYYVKADSQGYIRKWTIDSFSPPFYNFFVGFVGKNTLRTSDQSQGEFFVGDRPFFERFKEPLYRVVFVQKLLLICSLAFLAYVINSTLYSPLSSVIFVIGFFGCKTYSLYMNSLVTECLSQAFLLSALALFFLFFKSLNLKYLVLMTFVGVIAFLTRPAAIFILALPLSGFFLLFMRNGFSVFKSKKILGVGLVCASMVGATYMFEALRIPQNTSNVSIADKNFMGNLTNFLYAVAIGEKSDETMISEGRARDLFSASMKYKEKNPDVKLPSDALLFKVVAPATEEIGISRYSAEASLAYKEAAETILPSKIGSHLYARLKNFVLAWTRLGFYQSNSVFYLIVLFGSCFVVYLYGTTYMRWFSFTALMLHLAHILIMLLFLYPIRRYVNLSEFVLLIPIVIAFDILLKKLTVLVPGVRKWV